MEKSLLRFQPFDDQRKTHFYYHGALPHWRQRGCTYFVTFRLDDSIPPGVLNQWKYERDCWLRVRGIEPDQHGWKRAFERLNQSDQLQYTKHFASKLNNYLDRGCGSCVLTLPHCSQVVAKALDHFHGRRVETGDFTVMPNHVHALLTPLSDFDLEDILQSIKSFTAKRINEQTGKSGTVWMRESYDRIVRDGEELLRIQEYIRTNPKRAHLREEQFVVKEARYALELEHFSNS